MSTCKANNFQIGQSLTATNNFVLYQPAFPDGTVRLGNGNAGSVTDLVTLTSAGNLGIGTSSPAQKLDVVGYANITNATAGLSGTAKGTIRLYDSSSMASGVGAGVAFLGQATTGSSAYITAGSIQSYKVNGTSGDDGFGLQFTTRSNGNACATVMTLDASGNLGLGVTPSAWTNTNTSAMQLRNVSIAGVSSNDLHASANAYYDGSTWRYIAASVVASNYYQNAGTHVWRTTGTTTGAAGSAITFNPVMTLDASGNLGIGTSSISTGRAAIWGDGNGVATTSTNSNSQLHIVTTNLAAVNAYNAARITFNTGNGNGASAKIEAVRDGLDTFQIINNHSGPLVLGTNGSERARIDSSGNLLVGTNNAAASAGIGVKLRSFGSLYIVNDGSADGINYYNTAAAAYRFYVDATGRIYATYTTISAISDQRLKENIRDLDDGLSTILALKPRKFDWKEGKGKDIKDDRGFIAQEFEQVLPDLIDQWKDEPPEGEEPYKAVRADLIPMLVKAIQELSAEIETLKQRIK